MSSTLPTHSSHYEITLSTCNARFPSIDFTTTLLTHTHYTTAAATKNNATTTTHAPDRLHGSYHWDLERAASAALVPIVAGQLAFGASPVIDTLLGVVLPVHLHIGMHKQINHHHYAMH